MRNKLLIVLFVASGVCYGQQNFKAYYTKLHSGKDWESAFRMGDHADIVVQLSEGKFYFWRASSYLPRWETNTAAAYVSQAPFTFSGDGTGLRWDKLCRHSYVRIISSDDSSAVIHWRYAPVFDYASGPERPNWTGWVDEYYTVRSNHTFTRQVYNYDSGSRYSYDYALYLYTHIRMQTLLCKNNKLYMINIISNYPSKAT